MATPKVETLKTGALAKALKISRQRVNELGRVGKITREPDGRWCLEKVREQLATNLNGSNESRVQLAPGSERKPAKRVRTERPKTEKTPPKGTLLYEQWRHTREKADREAIDRKKLAGQLVEIAAVESEWTRVAREIRDGVMGIPGRLANRLPAEYRREVLAAAEDEARQVLMALSNGIRTHQQAA